MLSESGNQVEFLKQVLIFNEFSEAELIMVTERLNTEYVQAGKAIFKQGDDRNNFYIVASGELRATRREKDGGETFLANLEPTDTFGEDAFILERERSATITAITDTELYYLSGYNFNWVRQTFPKVEPYLIALTNSHETIRKLNIKWLNNEETISMAARRHPIRMIIELLGIAFLVSLALTISIAVITFLDDAQVITLLSMGTSGIITLIGLVAGAWSFFEWRNDYFFVTNLRVVWHERNLLQSASRQEVPLRAIQSLDIQTTNVFTRMIDVGDLVIRTFNNQLGLAYVHHPTRMKDMVDAFLRKARRRTLLVEQSAIRRTIRNRFGYEEETQPIEAQSETRVVQESRRGLTIFRNRIVEDGTITYRKHWWIFFLGAWKPSVALFCSVVISLILTTTVFSFTGILGLLAMYFIPFGVFVWWMYEYEDWRNDVYRVTNDRIIDRDKKPFGKESFRSAPIMNIQSVGHEIPNPIGLILNVGNVNINVGEETLTFEGVHDPALVHQDISSRMEELQEAAEHDRIQREHERMATWLEIYHEETRGEFDTGSEEHIPDFD